jgi:hypothetical protein
MLFGVYEQRFVGDFRIAFSIANRKAKLHSLCRMAATASESPKAVANRALGLTWQRQFVLNPVRLS